MKLIKCIEMLESLKDSIRKAGGTVPSTEELLSMTMETLLDKYAQNNIRFCHMDTLKDKHCQLPGTFVLHYLLTV